MNDWFPGGAEWDECNPKKIPDNLELGHEHHGWGRKGRRMKYKIVWHTSTIGLESLVNDKIAQGWKPLGGLCYRYDGDVYLQALIKEDE